MVRYLYTLLFIMLTTAVMAQNGMVTGVVSDVRSNKAVKGAEVFLMGTSYMSVTDAQGQYVIRGVAPGEYQLVVFYLETQTQIKNIVVKQGENRIDFAVDDIRINLEQVTIEDSPESNNGIRRLRSLEGSVINEGKKNEVIVIKDLTANLATNNARQIYAKVPGLNIWESDGAGLQLGIGARGLDPNRTSNFNVRQNGYDISADALGYPESYYTPPAEAIDRIEVVRGAASLQYGTQFGGLLNFVLHDGAKKPIEVVSRQTLGSFGLFNSFNSAGGTKGKVRYYAYWQHKQGDGWRPNSSFKLNTAYTMLTYTPSDRFTITGQYTYMTYLAQQPGGLTDVMFNQDPRQSIRERNWFAVDWNLMAVLADYKFSDRWKLNTRMFGLIGGRDALGNLGRIDRSDSGGDRDFFSDDFKNVGAEVRLVHHYTVMRNPSVMVVGARYYNGFTHRRQGLGPDGKEADFRFLNPQQLEGSDYDFPGRNVAVFAENIFNLSSKVSVTPGIRYEWIDTRADGYYRTTVLRPNPDTGIAEDSTYSVYEDKSRVRSFVIAGVGVSYKPKEQLEVYGNFSQNYRAINFNDIRVVNPNLVVDANIRDEKGFNADLGVRGGKGNRYNFDVSVFFLRYNDRIGSALRVDEETFRIYRYRTNIADSRHIGVEMFGQVDILALLRKQPVHSVLLFGNLSFIKARYVSAEESAFEGNEVELVPSYNVKAGITWKWKNLNVTAQSSFTSEQFSDATNAPFTPSAVEGIIPAYYVMDVSARYSYKFLTFESGVNNFTNQMYFTRRAAGYPGPGILPSDGRNFYVTVGVKL